MIRLSTNLARLRKKTGLSGQKFIDAVNASADSEISYKQYAAWEQGVNEPRIKYLLILSDYHKITINELCK